MKLSGTPDEPSAAAPGCRVGADAVERVAVAREEGGDVLGTVADGDGVDGDAPALQLQQHRRLGDAGHAPAGEDVEQRGSPVARSADAARPAGQLPAPARRRERLADQLRATVSSSAGCQAPCHRATKAASTSRARKRAGGSRLRTSSPRIRCRRSRTSGRQARAARRARSARRRARSGSRTASTTGAAATALDRRARRGRHRAGRSSGLDRRFVGRGRRRREEAALRLQHGAPEPCEARSSASSAVQLGPATGVTSRNSTSQGPTSIVSPGRAAASFSG